MKLQTQFIENTTEQYLNLAPETLKQIYCFIYQT